MVRKNRLSQWWPLTTSPALDGDRHCALRLSCCPSRERDAFRPRTVLMPSLVFREKPEQCKRCRERYGEIADEEERAPTRCN